PPPRNSAPSSRREKGGTLTTPLSPSKRSGSTLTPERANLFNRAVYAADISNSVKNRAIKILVSKRTRPADTSPKSSHTSNAPAAAQSTRVSNHNSAAAQMHAQSSLAPGLPVDTTPIDRVILIWPHEGVGAVSVTHGDRLRLRDDEFLNDTLIELGLKRISEALSANDPPAAKGVHMFNSFFYKKLSTKKPPSYHKGNWDAYSTVRKWTAKFDIFDKKFVIVPINEQLHWFLAIIINPGAILAAPTKRVNQSSTVADSDERGRGVVDPPLVNPLVDYLSAPSSLAPKPSPPSPLLARNLSRNDFALAPNPPRSGVPPQSSESHLIPQIAADDEVARLLSARGYDDSKCYIITFDSLGGTHGAVTKKLKGYLQSEAEDKKRKSSEEISVEENTVMGCAKEIPLQRNLSDCGLYLLHYVEMFLAKHSVLMREIVNERARTINAGDVTGVAARRQEIRDNWNEPAVLVKRSEMRKEVDALSREWVKFRAHLDAKDVADRMENNRKKKLKVGSASLTSL
ncbi:hypothetical protein P7C70_g8998, partial [Phenoliferia sp. Uapishka_3]